MDGLGLDAWMGRNRLGRLGFLAVIFLAGQSICIGEEAGIAYWGSFGEGASRVEGVFVELSDAGVFLGFDDELELAVYSSKINWRDESEFEFSGLISSPSDEGLIAATGHGRARTRAESEVILETQWVEPELLFQAYSSSSALYYRFELEGKASGEMHIVLDDQGTGYGLLLDSKAFLHGGLISLSDQGTHLFHTRRGDSLEFDMAKGAYTYALADGGKGDLNLQDSESTSLGDSLNYTSLSEFWNAFKKEKGDFSDSLHFILEGASSLPVSIESLVALDSRDLGVGFIDLSIELELYQLDHREDWNLMFSSGPLSRVKKSGSGEFDYHLSGFLPASLPRGTYLVQLSGLRDFSAEVEIRARFDRMDSIAAVNGSTMYERTASALSHRFGFELAGQGVRRAIVRSVGPGLAYFELDECTLNPHLTVFKNGMKRWTNEDWKDGVQPSSYIEPQMLDAGAFPLPSNSLDAVLSLSLGEGRYEASSDRLGDDFGFEIMEVYLTVESAQ